MTGAAGFIGYHVAEALLARGDRVIGLDNLNPYYDVRLKEARLERLRANPGLRFYQLDISDRDAIMRRFFERQNDISRSCIWRRRPACAIRWWIRIPMCSRTSWAIS